MTTCCCSTPPGALLTLSASLAKEIDFLSGTNAGLLIVVGVTGADDVAVTVVADVVLELLLDPLNEVMDRIENRLFFVGVVVAPTAGAGAAEVSLTDVFDVVGATAAAVGVVTLGAGDGDADVDTAVTPATIEDEILYGRVITFRKPFKKLRLKTSLFLGFILLGSVFLLSR